METCVAAQAIDEHIALQLDKDPEGDLHQFSEIRLPLIPKPVVHTGVNCDLCHKRVVGVRHKCIDCSGKCVRFHMELANMRTIKILILVITVLQGLKKLTLARINSLQLKYRVASLFTQYVETMIQDLSVNWSNTTLNAIFVNPISLVTVL